MNKWHTRSPAFGEMQLLEEIAQAAIAIIAGNDAFLLQIAIVNRRNWTRKAQNSNFFIWPNLDFNRFMQAIIFMKNGISKSLFNRHEREIEYFKRFSLTINFNDFLTDYFFFYQIKSSIKLYLNRPLEEILFIFL